MFETGHDAANRAVFRVLACGMQSGPYTAPAAFEDPQPWGDCLPSVPKLVFLACLQRSKLQPEYLVLLQPILFSRWVWPLPREGCASGDH
jgi:hypothetical protein